MEKIAQAIDSLKNIQGLTVAELAQAIVKASKEEEQQQSFEGVPTPQIFDQVKAAITELELRYKPIPEGLVRLNSLPIGSKVVDPNTKYYGEPITWLVAAKDHYLDNSTTLLAQNILTFKAFDAKEPTNSNERQADYGNNDYYLSNIHQWLNAKGANWFAATHEHDASPVEENVYRNAYSAEGGFLTNFSEAFLESLVEVSVPTYHLRNDSINFEAGVFLLSRTEVGLGEENGRAEGKLLELFKEEQFRKAFPTKVCTEKDSEGDHTETDWWWLRTPVASSSRGARGVDSSGALNGSSAYYGSIGVRPALNLLSSIAVKAVPNENGEHEIVWKEGV